MREMFLFSIATTLSKEILSVIEDYKEDSLLSIFREGSRIVPDMTYEEFVEKTRQYIEDIAATSSRIDHFDALFGLLLGDTKGFEAKSS